MKESTPLILARCHFEARKILLVMIALDWERRGWW
jgi:hypothetical protein